MLAGQVIALGVVKIGEYEVDEQVREGRKCKEYEKDLWRAIESQTQWNLNDTQDGQSPAKPAVDLCISCQSKAYKQRHTTVIHLPPTSMEHCASSVYSPSCVETSPTTLEK